tara:strand:- start:10789 stop:11373 length:585 start_codon:yes stop_codon:yes gene_type:complete
MALEKLTLARVGIASLGTLVGTANTVNFVGAGNTFLDHTNGLIDVSISGGGGGGLTAADSISNLLFIHYGEFPASKTLKTPQKFGEIFTHEDSTIDIDNGVTVDINDGCLLLTTDKTDFDMNFFADPVAGTNLMRSTGAFDENISCVFTSNAVLGTGYDKVGYSQIPTELSDDLSMDLENGVTVDVEDGAVMVL